MKKNSVKFVLSAQPLSTWLLFAYDAIAVVLAWVLAFLFRLNFVWDSKFLPVCLKILPLVLLVQFLTYCFFKAHRSVWKFSSILDMLKLGKAAVLATLILALLIFFMQGVDLPRSILLLYPVLLLALWTGARFIIRYRHEYGGGVANAKRVLVIGAGSAGEVFVRGIKQQGKHEFIPVGFLDDDKALHGREIHGVRVLGAIDDVARVIGRLDIDLIVVAIPSVSVKITRHVVDLTETLDVPIRVLPSVDDVASGRSSVTDLREVEIEDLLGRDPVEHDWSVVTQAIAGKTVLVTGGAGSIGSELCRQILLFKPSQLIVLDQSEFNLYSIQQELEKPGCGCEFNFFLQDVTDKEGLESLFKRYQPDLVYHAAAYKHVPMLEYQVRQAVRNNLLGTKAVAEAAAKYGVDKFVLVSSDKAVNPTNIMGATKRAAELFCQSFNTQVDTNFVVVRFGNVLGSAGSVVPLFKKQVAEGGPVTVTHPEITRYFMTIPEASQLILQAGAIGEGGEIFVLEMGEPIKIVDLAEKLIQLSGKKVGQEIIIKFVGLRPGEKMYEELFYGSEDLDETSVSKVLLAKHVSGDWAAVKNTIDGLESALPEENEGELVKALRGLVGSYQA